MDVPARQAYVAMVVAPDERSAAGGMTNLIRSLGSALGPILLGHLSSSPVHSWKFNSPWYIAGGLKIVYDVTLYGMYVFGSAFKETEASAARKDEEEKLHKK
jgi:MFS family permease